MKDIPIVRDFELKLDIFNEISEKTKTKKLLRIFVGSSVGDLGPLLEAEIGIVINPCDHLLAVGYQFGNLSLQSSALLPKPKSAAKLPSPPHYDILEPKPKNIGVNTLSPKSTTLLTLLLKVKDAVKLSLAENEAKTAKDENVKVEKQQAEKPKSAANIPSTENEAKIAEDENVEKSNKLRSQRVLQTYLQLRMKLRLLKMRM
ncbi:unnamed protein product [Prunus armeniaca]|uniref:Uncharacterized protein n=1 Tax=Prunus armeniaca TaxID=36596 RepID=A0A6J5XL23_PRUAR|nr:unnamed protein product [Prunus armeniaca]